MNSLRTLMKNIDHALAVQAINVGEAMRLTHHYTLNRRAALNVSYQAKAQLGDIALKVRTSLQTKRSNTL